MLLFVIPADVRRSFNARLHALVTQGWRGRSPAPAMPARPLAPVGAISMLAFAAVRDRRRGAYLIAAFSG